MRDETQAYCQTKEKWFETVPALVIPEVQNALAFTLFSPGARIPQPIQLQLCISNHSQTSQKQINKYHRNGSLQCMNMMKACMKKKRPWLVQQSV